MNKIKLFATLRVTLQAGLAALVLGLGAPAQALVAGWAGEDPGADNGNTRTFVLTAREDFISTSDGNSHYAWGYARGTDFVMQYPGPTLVVNQGDTVTIVLNNTLPVPVSIVFPGQSGVVATGGKAGQLTREAPAVAFGQNTVVGGPTYTFVASQAGTYQYHSGSNADLQIEMGLVGALIVRPSGFDYGVGASHANRRAYQNAGTGYDRENLFLLTEMDPAVHWAVYGMVQGGQPVLVDTTQIKPSMWFINGRNAPDTQLDDYVYWLPTQPYNALPRMHPGERLLMRVVNAGRDLHPFHHHGNHATAIARDGRVLSSNPALLAQAPDLVSPDFTVRSVPGQTMDLIYEWTGKGIGWDIYGTAAVNVHSCIPDANGFHSVASDENYREWCGDHYKALPVVLPGQMDLSFGEHASGSPFLGLTATLPQGHPGLNTTGGYYHMLHSHNEKEVTTDNIFPGGMMTMLVVEPWSVDLDASTGLAVTSTFANGNPGVTVLDIASENGSGNLNAERTALDFGNPNGNSTVTNTVTLMNTGVAPAVLGQPVVANTAGGAYSVASGGSCVAGLTVLIQGTCTVRVAFNPANNSTKTATLTVPYNGNAPLVLGLSGR
jgi:FtsP/CotA-like multicopper oxidase with cupredoxin domain